MSRNPEPRAEPVWRQLLHRFIRRADSEHEQVLIRFVVGLLLVGYFWSPYVADIVALPLNLLIMKIGITVFLLFAVAQTIAILLHPEPSPVRRVLAILVDLGLTSYALYLGGEAGIPLIAVYLWVVTGNGFRFGIRYLAIAEAVALIGFATAAAFNDYFRSHLLLTASLFIILLAIPSYIAVLLDKLQRAIREAREASRAKSQFIAKMSHELRTPLNGVIGLSDLLLESRLDREQRDLVEGIRQSAATQLDLIEEVLDFSRLEAGRLTLQEEDFDLRQFLDSLAMMFRPQARRKRLEFAVEVPGNLPFLLRGDVQHLRQVLVNLIGNALKFTERGRIDLKVRMIGFDDGERVRLRFDVCDTGIGMSEEEQRRIFESFTQANSEISRRFGGTGLGTTIARQLVGLMGGELHVESSPGKGSCFWFVLPLRMQQPEGEGLEQSRELASGAPVWVLARHPLSLHLGDLLNGWHLEHEMTDDAARLQDWIDRLAGQGSGRRVLLLEQSLLGEDPYSFVEHLHQSMGGTELAPILLAPPPMKVQEAQLLAAGYSAVLYTPVDKVHLYNAVHAAQVGQGQQTEKVVPLFEHYRNRGGEAGLNILIAEDNPTNRMVLRGILEKAGHGVNEVADGEAALELLEEVGDDIDLVILDMNMPGMNGLEVMRAWRFLDTGRRIPTIILTANASEEARAASEEAGVDAFLTKPVDARRLLDTIARLSLAEGERQRAELARKELDRQVSPAGDGLISPAVLEQLDALGGGNGFLERLVAGWLRDAEHSLETLQRSHREKDFPLWLDTLHALKGSAGELGLQRLMRAAAEAERLRAYDNGSERQREVLDGLVALFEDSRAALEKFLAERAGEAG